MYYRPHGVKLRGLL